MTTFFAKQKRNTMFSKGISALRLTLIIFLLSLLPTSAWAVNWVTETPITTSSSAYIMDKGTSSFLMAGRGESNALDVASASLSPSVWQLDSKSRLKSSSYYLYIGTGSSTGAKTNSTSTSGVDYYSGITFTAHSDNSSYYIARKGISSYYLYVNGTKITASTAGSKNGAWLFIRPTQFNNHWSIVAWEEEKTKVTSAGYGTSNLPNDYYNQIATAMGLSTQPINISEDDLTSNYNNAADAIKNWLAQTEDSNPANVKTAYSNALKFLADIDESAEKNQALIDLEKCKSVPEIEAIIARFRLVAEFSLIGDDHLRMDNTATIGYAKTTDDVTYSIDNTDIISYNPTTHVVTALRKVGSAKLTLTQPADSKHVAVSQSFTFTVSKRDVTSIVWVGETTFDPGFNLTNQFKAYDGSNEIADVEWSDFVSDNDAVVRNLDKRAMLGGIATLSITCNESAVYNAKTGSQVVTVNPAEHFLEWNQSFINFSTKPDGTIDEYRTLTARAIDSTGVETHVPVSYAITEGAGIAEVVDGQLHVFGVGDAVITATTVAGQYAAISESRAIRVRTSGTACGTYVLEKEDTKTFKQIGNAGYLLGGNADKLSFEVKKFSLLTIGSSSLEGYDGKEWKQICKLDLDTDWKLYENINVENYSALRWTTSSEPGSKYVRNVFVSQKSYLTPSISSSDRTSMKIAVGQEYSEDFTVSYSDVPLIQYALKNPETSGLMLTAKQEIANDCGDYGTYTFTISGTWNKAMDIDDVILITTSAGHHIEIPVHWKVDVSGNCTSVHDGVWNESTNWEYSGTGTRVPAMDNSVTIDNVITVKGDVAAYQISFTANGKLIIDADGGLTLGAGGFVGANETNLIIKSTQSSQGYFRMSPESSREMPKAVVEYATKATLDNGYGNNAAWQFFGVPCETEFTAPHNVWMLPYDESSTTDGWGDYITTATLQPFACYTVTQYGQPTYQFQGKLTNANVDITLSKTDGAAFSGENMFANSYMAPLDIKTFDDDDFDAGIEKVFYLYNTGSWNQWNEQNSQGKAETFEATSTPGQYHAIAVRSSAVLDPEFDQSLIAPMQGVLIKTSIDGAKLHLNYKKHVWNAKQTTGNDFNKPMRVAAADNQSDDEFALSYRVRLAVNSENSGADRIYLLENEEFTSQYDNGWDAPKLMGEGLMNIYTNEDAGQMSVSATDNVENMYIGFQAGADYEYTMYITSVIGDELFLRDNVSGETYPLISDTQFTFYAEPNTKDDFRFQVLPEDPNNFNSGVTTSVDNVSSSTRVWSNGTNLYIAGAEQNTTAWMFTADGHLVSAIQLQHGSATLDLAQLPTGVYCVRVADTAYKFVK